VVCLEGAVREFCERRRFDIPLTRNTIKQVCGYKGTFGSTSRKVVPNLNVVLRNARLGKEVVAHESQAPDSTLAGLRQVCKSETASFPIVALGKEYWSVQTHLKVRNPGEMEHTVIVLDAGEDEVSYFDPFQRMPAAGDAPSTVRQMSTVTFLRLWQEALMAPAWVLWLAQTRERPTLEAFGRKTRHA
jgi:hypothetical protein